MKPVAGKSLLTPKEMAQVIGVSESSLRRWVDAGDIRIARTAGGHRRIPLQEAIRFIRHLRAPIVRPEILGLGPAVASAQAGGDEGEDAQLFELLQAGRTEAAKGLIVSWYLGGAELAAIFDGPMAGAFRRLGQLWHHEERAILIEHRATEICIEAIAALRGLIPAAPVEQRAEANDRPPALPPPLAIGGAPAGDPYQLPSQMAAAVLMDAGLRDVNFGANTPLELLGREAIDRGAALVWVSVSTVRPVEGAVVGPSLAGMADLLAAQPTQIVVGGRHCADVLPPGRANVRVLGSMSELAALGREIRGGPSGAAG